MPKTKHKKWNRKNNKKKNENNISNRNALIETS